MHSSRICTAHVLTVVPVCWGVGGGEVKSMANPGRGLVRSMTYPWGCEISDLSWGLGGGG